MNRPWGAAARAVVATSLLFVVLYNACNHLTRWRPDVGVWAFDWERHWPLWPAMIVPYWSIDLLFLTAPFCCRSTGEVALLRRRITFAIMGSCLGFLLIPLRFAFPRPEVTGVFGPWFSALRGFDLPYNLFPSLHIALRTILAHFYVQKTSGGLRWLTHVWFSLIGLSTLVTWQHHLIDVLGGFLLAAIILQIVRPTGAGQPQAKNLRVSWLYAVGAIACSQLARWSWPQTVILVWPAFALGAAACSYAGLGEIYQKRDGRLTLLTKLLFAPVLLGQWASWAWYRRQSRAWDELAPQVWIGRILTELEAGNAIERGVTAVLDLTAEFSAPAAFRRSRYRNIPVLDLTAPTSAQLREMAAFVHDESARGVVYIHCKAGYSRTAAGATAWLLASGTCPDAADAFARLREIRPRIVIRPEIRALFAGGGAGGASRSESDRSMSR